MDPYSIFLIKKLKITWQPKYLSRSYNVIYLLNFWDEHQKALLTQTIWYHWGPSILSNATFKGVPEYL